MTTGCRYTHAHVWQWQHAYSATHTKEAILACMPLQQPWPKQQASVWGLGSVLGWRMAWHSPLIAELAGEAVKVIHIVSGSHHHLESWDQLAAGSAVSCGAKKPARGRAWRIQGPAKELPPPKDLPLSLAHGIAGEPIPRTTARLSLKKLASPFPGGYVTWSRVLAHTIPLHPFQVSTRLPQGWPLSKGSRPSQA